MHEIMIIFHDEPTYMYNVHVYEIIDTRKIFIIYTKLNIII